MREGGFQIKELIGLITHPDMAPHDWLNLICGDDEFWSNDDSHNRMIDTL
jgi:hypothetical protein